MIGRHRLALVAMLALVYAGCYSAIKAGLVFAPPLRFAGLRAVIGGVALALVLAAMRQPVLPPRRMWRLVTGLALTGVVLAYGAMFLSPGRTGAGLSSVLGNTGPLILAGMARVFLGERLTAGAIMAMVLGFIGVTLIASPSVGSPGLSGTTAILIPLLAATGTASESVLFKGARTGQAFVTVAAWQLLLGGGILLTASTWLERGGTIQWTGEFIILLGFLGLVGTALALTTWYWLAQQHAVGQLGLLLFLVPALGLGLAVLLFGEPLRPVDVVGAAVTVVGLGALAMEWWSAGTSTQATAGGTPP